MCVQQISTVPKHVLTVTCWRVLAIRGRLSVVVVAVWSGVVITARGRGIVVLAMWCIIEVVAVVIARTAAVALRIPGAIPLVCSSSGWCPRGLVVWL